MTFEERVLAVKAKFQEAADELLELASQSPSAVSDIMQVAWPDSRVGWSIRRVVETTITAPDGQMAGDRFEVPNLFVDFDRRRTRHEKHPVDVIVPEARVVVSVGVWPENEKRSDAFRQLAAGDVAPEEYMRRVEEANEEEGLYESWGDDFLDDPGENG